MKLVRDDEINQVKELKEYGPEPLDKKFTMRAFDAAASKRRHGKIKLVLMDSKVVAGIGNIYSDEILPDFLLKSLEMEINTNLQYYVTQNSIFDTLYEKTVLTLDDFTNRQESYNQLFDAGYKTISREFIKDLEWLEDFVTLPDLLDEDDRIYISKANVNIEESEKYKRILKTMDFIRQKFFDLRKDNNPIVESADLVYPKFVFDNFIFHTFGIIYL
jgi:hypothetical protein